MSIRHLAPLAAALALTTAACTPSDIGRPCSSDDDEVAAAVAQVDGTNDLVGDVRFENCAAAFCLSTKADALDGARPYCTEPCVTDADCGGAPGFSCEIVIRFGPLACRDFEDPEAERPGFEGRSSGAPCEVDPDCADHEGETCFASGPRGGTCGFAGRDCATGPGGALSARAIRYCAAGAGALAAIDAH